jgi:hypothetical protein
MPDFDPSIDTLCGRCLECGYSLEGLEIGEETRCPECGALAEQLTVGERLVCVESAAREGNARRSRAKMTMITLVVMATLYLIGELSSSPTRTNRLVFMLTVAGVMFLIFLAIYIYEPRYSGRIALDRRARTIEFRGLRVERPLRWAPRRTLQVSFDEVLGSEMQGGFLLITTAQGRVRVPPHFTNFHLLGRTVRAIAPRKPPAMYRFWLFYLVVALAVVAVTGAALYYGLHVVWR